MEIYTNAKAADRTVFLEFPEAATTVDCFVYKNDELLFEIETVTNILGEGYSVVLPLYLLQNDGPLDVRWVLTYSEPSAAPAFELVHTINRTTKVEVVTPILSKKEIKAVWDTATDAEVVTIEKAVRHIIQAYTGQSFGHWHGTVKVKGSQSSALFSPTKIIELQSVNGIQTPNNYVIDPDGYVVRHYPWGVPPVKADYHELHMHTGGVIHDPNNVRWSYWSQRSYELTGRFGWEEIPAAVKEAAKLLVNDYACADSQYRDRYLTSMTAADWRVQFHSGAFLRTGNVRADQLLSEYVVTRGWGVI